MRKYLNYIFIISLLVLIGTHNVWAQGRQIILRVDGLACPFCAYGLEKKLLKMEGAVSYDADLEAGEVYVEFKEGAKIDTAVIMQAVKESGFTLRKIFLKNGGKIEELELSNP